MNAASSPVTLRKSAFPASSPLGRSKATNVRIRWRELMALFAMGLGFVPLSKSGARQPALCNHVSKVVVAGPNPEMCGVDAGRVVAAMENPQPLWNRAAQEFPCKPIGAEHSAIHVHPAVSVFVASTDPRPTVVRSTPVNFRPKTLIGCHHSSFNIASAGAYFNSRILA